MLIDDFLPRYDFAEQHSVIINAPAEPVYAAVHTLDFSGSPVIRRLLRLRGLPATSLKKDGLLRIGFILLGEMPPHELLLGLVGQFWTPSGHLVRMDSLGFREFNQPGYAKTVWNFAIAQQAQGTIRLTTETRIFCPDPPSRRRFRMYWLAIKPFSAWIRREILRMVRKQVEQSSQPPEHQR